MRGRPTHTHTLTYSQILTSRGGIDQGWRIRQGNYVQGDIWLKIEKQTAILSKQL